MCSWVWKGKRKELQDLVLHVILISAAIMLQVHAAAIHFDKTTDNNVRNCSLGMAYLVKNEG